MAKIFRILSCSTQNLRKWSANPRIYVLVLLLLGLLSEVIRPIARFFFCRAGGGNPVGVSLSRTQSKSTFIAYARDCPAVL